ncbi:MAG: hypothetical protein KKH68_10700, partial [Proteobacteria bacterium]|nr:hypothetical protein [Pseudomonadota bacterium]
MDLTHPSNNYRRYYRIAGITIQVEAELPITDTTFQPKFRLFEVDEPGDDTILIRHRFSRPAATITAGADEIYRTPPWVIYKKNNS